MSDVVRALLGSPARAAATPVDMDMLPIMSGGAYVQPYEPDLRDTIGNVVYDAARYLGLPNANRMREDTTNLVDFVPFVGDAVGFNDARQDFNAGNYGSAAMNAGASLVGAIPGGGDLVAGLLKAAPFLPPGAADKLKTGWIFKDVQHPGRELTRADNKQISNYIGVREEVVPVRSLYATQEGVNPDFMTTESSSGELPFVIRKNGNLYTQDGHHRIMRAANQGSDNVRVRFMDLDRRDTATPLLDYRAPTAQDMEDDLALLRELGL